MFREQKTRRHFSKSESLLVSLLKQEAISEKKPDIQLHNGSPVRMAQPNMSMQKSDKIDDSNNIDIKLEKNDIDFILKDPIVTKKATQKSQVFYSILFNSMKRIFIYIFFLFLKMRPFH